MAGVKGMKWEKPASTSPVVAEVIRARIKALEIAEALAKHTLGEIEMTRSQVTAGLGLLRKVVADKSESKIDATVRTGPLLSPEQAAQMAEAMIDAARGDDQQGATDSKRRAHPVRNRQPA